MYTLDLMNVGERGCIHSVNGGSRFMGRISAMGFTPDTEVIMIYRRGGGRGIKNSLGRPKRNGRMTGGGPVIVYLRDTEVALGRREAARIRMKEDVK